MERAVGRVARRLGVEEELTRAYRKALSLRLSIPEKKVLPENMIWIFGTGRSGSTWIARMLRDLRGYALWNEPLVGHMLGTCITTAGPRSST